MIDTLINKNKLLKNIHCTEDRLTNHIEGNVITDFANSQQAHIVKKELASTSSNKLSYGASFYC